MVLPPPGLSQSARRKLVLIAIQIQPGSRKTHAQRAATIGNRYSVVAPTNRRLSAREKEAYQRHGEEHSRCF